MIPHGILLPIKRKYSKLILDGKKIAEARKQIPKINLPCHVYIYESFGTQRYVTDDRWGDKYDEWFGYEIFKKINPYTHLRLITEGRGSIVARFTLETIEPLYPAWPTRWIADDLLQDLKLTQQDLIDYGTINSGFAWRINDLQLVKEVSLSDINIKHAPQSFMYLSKEQVDEIERLNGIPF